MKSVRRWLQARCDKWLSDVPSHGLSSFLALLVFSYTPTSVFKFCLSCFQVKLTGVIANKVLGSSRYSLFMKTILYFRVSFSEKRNPFPENQNRSESTKMVILKPQTKRTRSKILSYTKYDLPLELEKVSPCLKFFSGSGRHPNKIRLY